MSPGRDLSSELISALAEIRQVICSSIRHLNPNANGEVLQVLSLTFNAIVTKFSSRMQYLYRLFAKACFEL